MSVFAYLTPDEQRAWSETDAWLGTEASRFQKVLGFTRKPLEFAYSKVPETLREAIANAILSVLTGVRDGSASLVSPASVRALIPELGSDEGAVFRVGVRRLDAVAQHLISSSKTLCTAEGAATGAVGLPGIVVDIPALYGLLFRMIGQISVCYGFSADGEDERSHILKVLDVGHLLEPEERRQGMDELARIQEMMREDVPVLEVQRFAVQKGLQTMARHLGLALTQRKLAQSVALVGGVVGAGVNRQMAGEVGEVAFHAYRRRYLMELVQLRRDGKMAGRRVGSDEPASASEASEPSEPVATESGSSKVESFDSSRTSDASEVSADEASSNPSSPSNPPSDLGIATFRMTAEQVNGLLSRLPDYELRYGQGRLMARVKLPITTANVVVVPSFTPAHLLLTIPFAQITAEGAGGFLVSRAVSAFWGTIAKQVEGVLLPRLRQEGFSSEFVVLEKSGDTGVVRISVPELNRWLAMRGPQFPSEVVLLEFLAEEVLAEVRVGLAI